jgi:adenine-specific DNA-methyltransferase
MQTKKIEDMSKEELVDLVKQLKKRKKYGLVWEEKPEDVVEQCKNELPVLEEVQDRAIIKDKDQSVNLIIEGDNYHALSVLNYTHAGKIDVIYIDPPFNTGAKDWKYNNNYVDITDGYRHSKWLSMMSNRLRITKNLLKDDGVLICAIDENEFYRLGLLIEEIFNDFEIHCITIVHNPRGIQGKNFSYTHEYAFFIFRKGLQVIGPRKIRTDDIDWRNLRDNGGESLRTDAKNCFYPIIIKDDNIVGFGDIVPNDVHPETQTKKNGQYFYVYPIDRNKIERKWRYARQSVENVKNLLRARKTKTGYEIDIGKDFGTVRTVWQDSRYDSNEYGTKLVHALVPSSHFDFPKSVFNTYDCIAPIIYNKKNAIVLDYFAGSGTTGHAVMLINKEDGGNRQFILCTNNENNIAEEVCYPRIMKVIEGVDDYPDITGITANLRYFKTSFVSKFKVSDDTRWELLKRSTEMICIRENTFNKVIDDFGYKIYQDTKHTTGILFDLDELEIFKEKIRERKLPANIYVFSLTNDAFNEDFEDLGLEHQLCPIPESILEVYRKLFK